MLLGPTYDTFKAQAECRANKLTLTRGRENTFQDRPFTVLHGPIGRFLNRPAMEHCYDKPIKATTRLVYECDIFTITFRENPFAISSTTFFVDHFMLESLKISEIDGLFVEILLNKVSGNEG